MKKTIKKENRIWKIIKKYWDKLVYILLISLLVFLFIKEQYLYVVLCLIVIGLWFIFKPIFNRIDERLKIFNEYIVVIIGTLVGVYLALYLSRTYEAKREQDDVIDLIFAIREDAGNIRYMNTLLMETNKGKTYYYEPRRTLLQNFINSEKLVTNIVRSTLRNLLIVSGEITQFQSAINPQMNNRESESQLTLYNIYLTRIMELSNIEINFIRKDVDYDTFADMQNQSLLRLYYRIDSLKAIDSLEAVKSFEKIESQQPVDTLE